MKDFFEDLKTYLPKYLSDDNVKKLFDELQSFPNNIDGRMYTDILDNENILFQGDGFKGFPIINLPNAKVYENASVIILSNTCDIDSTNTRNFPSLICYAPIFSFDKYISQVRRDKLSKNSGDFSKTETDIKNHIEAIKAQKITQIFYLPKGKGLPEDSIVFFDRINNCSNHFISRDNLKSKRLFVLSNYGFYLFLVKLSIHFTRIQEKVDRQ